MKLNPKKAFIRIYPEQYSIFGELGHDRLAVAGPANYGVSFLKLLEAALEELNLGGGSTVTTNTINYNNGTLTSSVNGVSDTTVITLSSPTVAGLMSSQQFSDLIDVLVDVTNLQTLTGIPDGDTDLGTFTGSVISDNVSIKQALQELENALGGPTASDLSNGTQTATEAPILNSNGDGVSLPLATNTLAGLASAAQIAAIEKSIGDIADLLSVIGVADGDTTPTYTSTNIVDANDNIEEAISKLDAARKEKIEIPNTAFVDVTNPTIPEVRTWVDANLTDLQKVNSQLYLGDINNPDFTWDLINNSITDNNVVANNGLSRNSTSRYIQLGQKVFETGNPASLIENREIPLAGRRLYLSNTGGQGHLIIGPNFRTPSGGALVHIEDTRSDATQSVYLQKATGATGNVFRIFNAGTGQALVAQNDNGGTTARISVSEADINTPMIIEGLLSATNGQISTRSRISLQTSETGQPNVIPLDNFGWKTNYDFTNPDGVGISTKFLNTIKYDDVANNVVSTTWSGNRGGVEKPILNLTETKENIAVATAEQVFKVKPMTSTVALTIDKEDGMVIYVSDTNATFIQTGFWMHENGNWTKM